MSGFCEVAFKRVGGGFGTVGYADFCEDGGKMVLYDVCGDSKLHHQHMFHSCRRLYHIRLARLTPLKWGLRREGGCDTFPRVAIQRFQHDQNVS